MSNKYLQGYQCAGEFNWDALPVETVLERIDGLKARALDKNNEYLAGFAQGVEDSLRRRVVPV